MSASPTGPGITVIVPVHDNAAGVRRTLSALSAIIGEHDQLEVVVVDDGSTDDTPGALPETLRPFAVHRIVTTSNQGAAAARNIGASAAMHDVLVFLDANDEPLPGWLAGFARQLGTGVGIAHCRPTFSDPTIRMEYGFLLPGCFAISRALFTALGGYDPQLRFAENTDLVERAHVLCASAGIGVSFADETLLAVHDVSDSRRYDSDRLDAMSYLLDRDATVLRYDRRRMERLARIGAVNAARSGQPKRARTLAWTAVRARPSSPRNWLRVVMTVVPLLGRCRWSSGSNQSTRLPDSPELADGPGAVLREHDYSAGFDESLRSFLHTRGGDKWLVLHGNGPLSRMAGFEGSTLPELILHTGELDGKRVLDFGCGSGTITPSLALRANEVVAFDVNADAVATTHARLREHNFGHVAVHHAGSYRDVAAQLGSFDLVVAHAVFEHVPLSVPGLRADVLRQAFDALSPGGHLFIAESPNRLLPRDIYCTGLWFIPWTRGGSTWAYRRTIRAGRHTDPEGRGPISLEERGAWGFTYWAVRRALRGRPHDVVNAQPGHDRWVRYNRRLSAKRRVFESVVHHLVTRTTRTPIVAFAPMLSPLVIRRRG